MSVKEYALDINKTVDEILEQCKVLGFDVQGEDDLLDDYMITELDNTIAKGAAVDVEDVIQDEEELEDIQENLTKNDEPDTLRSSTVKKKQPNLSSKKEFVSKKEYASKKKDIYKNKEKLMSNTNQDDSSIVLFTDGMTISDFAKELNVSAAEIIKKLFMLGVVTNVNSAISYDSAEIVALDYKKELKKAEKSDVSNFEEFEVTDKEEDLVPRAPVVTIMGHVDHGKTTLLDYIRKSNVAAGEAGGITQAISAYQVKYKDKPITFIDTPGHAAFTEMRARGAKITDIIIIIVAADDGVMPQTIEAIDHAKAAGVPIIVAINKMDKPGVKPDKVMEDLGKLGLMPDEWGGNTLYNKISASTGEGVNELLDNILLVADMENYRANPNRYAIGTVIESRLDKHLGPVVTVLIQNGTLRLSDPLVVGTSFGKVRTMRNDSGMDITEAKPSLPVEITGLDEVPQAGDKFMAFETEKEAREVAEKRKEQAHRKESVPVQSLSLDDLFDKIKEGTKEINILVKADVNGSAEAVKNSLEKIDVEGVKVNVISSRVGAITDSDIVLARASNAIILAFNIRPTNSIKDYAKENGVEIRTYDIIYKAIEDVEASMKGMLDPEYEEKILGTAKVRQLFKFSKVGIIAGSYVEDGIMKNGAKARVLRDSVVIYDGVIGSLQREKDSVKEVKKGLECGLTIANFSDIKVGDQIEAYEMVEVPR